MTAPVAPILYNLAQAREALAMGQTAIYGAMCRNVDPLPSIKVGKSRRFVVRDLEAWVARQVNG